MTFCPLRRCGIVGVVLVVALWSAGCDDNVDEPVDVDPEPELTDAVDIATFTTGTFAEVAELLDFDSSSRIDQDDFDWLEEAIAEGDLAAHPEADLVPDGELNELDWRLFELLVGTVSPRTDEQILRLADEIDQFADGEFEADLTPLAIDYEEDGDNDEDDMHFLANALRDDPVNRFDFDESGYLSFNDVSIAAHAVEAATEETDLSTYDIGGDGTTNDMDLMLLAELATLTNDFTIGLIDYNADGAVDLSDYCIVIEGEEQQNFYGMLMPEADGDDAFAADPHACAICRADGASYLTFPLDYTTELTIVILPHNLYIVAVDELPDGYDPIGEAPTDDSPLFVVGTDPTGQPLHSFSLPHDPPAPGVAGTHLQIGGGGLPENSVLATPNAFIELGPDVSESGSAGPTGPRMGQSRHAVRLIERLIEQSDAEQIRAFDNTLRNVLTTYDLYIANECPCDSTPQQRAQLVRELIRARNCLETVRAAAQRELESDEQDHRLVTRAHQLSGRLAALGWYQLSETIVEMEWVKTMMLIVSTIRDISTKGLPGAFAEALNSLVSEVVSDATATDFFGTGPPGGPVSDMLSGMSISTANGMFSNQVANALGDLINVQRTSPLSLREFTHGLIEGVGDHLGRAGAPDAPGVRAYVENLIKLIPVLYVDYVKRMAFARESQGRNNAYAYFRSTLSIRSRQQLVDSLTSAQNDLDNRLEGLLRAFETAGCPMYSGTADPCMPDFAAAIESAHDALGRTIADADARIAEALEGIAPDEATYECFAGAGRADVDNAEAQLRDVSAQLWRNVAQGNPEGAVRQLAVEMEHLNSPRRAARERWALAMSVPFLRGNANDDATWMALAAADRDRRQALDDYESALNRALQIYIACSSDGGGECISAAGLEESPWVAAVACLQCVPHISWECAFEICDDGVDNDDDGFTDCDDSDCMYTETCPLSEVPIITDWLEDFIDDLFFSISTSVATFTENQIDISGTGHRVDDMVAETMAYLFNESVVECDTTTEMGTVVCPAGVTDMPAGELLTVAMQLHATVPLADSGHSYIYSVVFDSDGVAANDWVFHPPYDWDLFRGADRWYQLDWNHRTSTWGLTVTQVSSSQTTSTATSSVRALIAGDTVTFYVPMSELSDDAAYRLCAFGHDGAYSPDDSGADVNGTDPTEPLTPVR